MDELLELSNTLVDEDAILSFQGSRKCPFVGAAE